jgi:hypothetical protein
LRSIFRSGTLGLLYPTPSDGASRVAIPVPSPEISHVALRFAGDPWPAGDDRFYVCSNDAG